MFCSTEPIIAPILAKGCGLATAYLFPEAPLEFLFGETAAGPVRLAPDRGELPPPRGFMFDPRFGLKAPPPNYRVP